ncbi:MAB_1171c family putative transporter [Streptomyces sp. NPDC002088]|uniref:MAB_1171c family putative transporter n=1 Tax=Streptomyces sp. NPDC002088 TaxID=3154665 RepID=UPI00331B47B1
MSLVVYVAAVVLGLSGAVLFRRPRAGVRAVRNPLTVSTCAAIALGTLVFVCSAPLTLAAVNDLTGIPNFGAPLTYGMLSAYSCSLFILLINWRGGSRERIRRTALCGIAAYGALIVAIVVLFALADAHTERLTDLDTYYADTPYMREMIVLYLVGHSAATVGLCAVGVKWGREVTGLLLTGLRLILIGSLLDVVGFQLTKYTAVVARWSGHDLDFLSTSIAPPMASLGALTCSVGFVLPRLLPSVAAHWHSLRDLRSLGPLWSALRFASTAPPAPGSWWRLPRERLQWREVAIHDALLALAPYFDDRVRERALDSALRAGRSPHRARVAAEAAMLAAAARHATARARPLDTPSGYRLHATQVSTTSGLAELVELAQEFTESSRVGAAREGTVTATPDRTQGAP